MVTPSPAAGIVSDKEMDRLSLYRKGWSEFCKRNFRLDVSGGVYTYLKMMLSDYLIIDFGDLRNGLYRMLDEEAYLTGSWTEEVPNMVRKGLMSDKFRRIRTEELEDKLFYKYMEMYIEMLLDLYDEDRIIINECYAVHHYVTSDKKEIKCFSAEVVEGYNRIIKKGFEFAKTKLTASHVIPFPRGVIGDENHKWGKGALHFVKEYYDYGLKAVDIICHVGDMAEEKKELRGLSEEYGEMLERRYQIQKGRVVADSNNNLSTLFTKIEKMNVFGDDFCENLSKSYQDFFCYDQKLAHGDPRDCSMEDERILTKDGRFSIDHRGVHFEAFFKGGFADGVGTKTLIVSFDGARIRKGEFRKVLPGFPRWSWYTFIDGNFLCLEDPMYYRYDNLRVGWFYGTGDEDYAEYAADIIRKAALELGIKNEDIILYASSAGGTAAIRAGAFLKGCKVVAINPQLNINAYWYAEKFAEITGNDLSKKDSYHRNDLSYLVEHVPDTKFLIIVNAESREDIKLQLQNFYTGLGAEKPRYGLSGHKNVIFWIYDGPGERPHNVQEDYRIYYYIRYILPSLSRQDFVEAHRNEVLYLNDWWRSITSAKQEKMMTARIDLRNIGTEQNAVEIIEISDSKAVIQMPEWFQKDGRGKGCVVQSVRGGLYIRLKCIKDGELQIVLRGKDVRGGDKKRIPFWVDYTSLYINGEKIFDDTIKSVWHDAPYRVMRKVKNNDVVCVAVSWQSHK